MINDRYELIADEEIKDIASVGRLYRHKKTGARVMVISNDDNNKVFSIAFRTPPPDSTGAAHIVEHTVLCGSAKFPVKDPFVELVKGSLNTFLNAMTFPDKTMYPVASCNDTDFRNLMEVYMDAVFYPNIYNERKIFEQEGWHYHLENADDPLTCNGVVYNEMKGAFSTAESVLERNVFNALFPDTPYGVESGGDPDHITELTYEAFLDFHRKYYHPSNSYIYLYGNMDVVERLDWMDKEYLSRFDKTDIDSLIPRQKTFTEPKELELEYPVLDEEPEEENTFLDASFVISDVPDVLTDMAFNVIEYVLLDAPGAPLKQALLDAGAGKDITGTYNDGILQPFFSIDAKYADPSDMVNFRTVIKDTLGKLCDEGLNRKALEAAINYFEFRFREADFATYPKGLIYAMTVMESWLYDDSRPFDYLRQLDVFAELKKNIGTGYYERLIKRELIDNPHGVFVTLIPKRGLGAKKKKEEEEKLASYRETLDEEGISKILKDTEDLKKYQESADTDEAIASIPMLKKEDMSPEPGFRIKNRIISVNGADTVVHDYETNGISYLTLMFEIKDLPDEMVGFVSLLKAVLGNVNTERFSYNELSNEINARTGGIVYGLESFVTGEGTDRRFFGIRAKYLYPETEFVFSMIEETLFRSDFSDDKRLYEIIASQKSYYQDYLAAAGHISAAGRAASFISENAGWEERVSGLSHYRFLEELYSGFETEKEKIATAFDSILKHILRAENMIVSVTAEEEGIRRLDGPVGHLKDLLYDGSYSLNGSFKWERKEISEAFKTSGQVQYVAEAGNFAEKGHHYTGALRVLRVILNYDYLWMNLRMKGGAYGCMSMFRRSGLCHLVSYRDPHLKNTLEIYRELGEYLRSFDADELTMTKYIIGTISELDTPINSNAKGKAAMTAFFSGISDDDIRKERDEVLTVSCETIRGLADLVEDAFSDKHICVLGSAASIDKHKEIFDIIDNLVKA